MNPDIEKKSSDIGKINPRIGKISGDLGKSICTAAYGSIPPLPLTISIFNCSLYCKAKGLVDRIVRCS